MFIVFGGLGEFFLFYSFFIVIGLELIVGRVRYLFGVDGVRLGFYRFLDRSIEFDRR